MWAERRSSRELLNECDDLLKELRQLVEGDPSPSMG